MTVQLAARVVACSLIVSAAWEAPAAATFPWRPEFTKASSPALAALDRQIHAAHAGELRTFRVERQIWAEEDFKLEIESGTIHLEPRVQERTVGAYFEGKATFSFAPRLEGPRGLLRIHFGRPALERVPVESAYIFSLRPTSLLTALEERGGGVERSGPKDAARYAADKSALRQLGLEATAAFLNRDGVAAGTTYVLLPMERIRSPRSPEARVLYRFNPTSGLSVSLSVFGYEELLPDPIPLRPYKEQFQTVVSYAGDRESSGQADVERTVVKVVPGLGGRPASEEATLHLKLAPGVKALRLVLTIRMVVSEITGPNGEAIPFLQWEWIKTLPTADQSILMLLEDPAVAGGTRSPITIDSQGLLFEPVGSFHRLLDADNWYPRFASRDDAHHELHLTIPLEMAGIGIGEKVSETIQGRAKTVVFKTTQPAQASTFYYGDYAVEVGEAAGVAIEVYVNKKDITEKQNARRTLREIAGAVDFHSRTLGSLDIKVLRAATTPTFDARGFEGLILLGRAGTQTDDRAHADVSRAHEVAHQWWGGSVRHKHWPRDRWLFEALAEFTAMEYYRSRSDDAKSALDAMRRRWFEPLTFGTLTRRNLAGVREELAGGSIYPLLAAGDDVYTKGPMVLRMLRCLFADRKGDDGTFLVMLKDFLQDHRHAPAGTEDFKRAAEEHLGESLDWFFDQWVAGDGLPVLVWHQETRRSGDGWRVDLEARQEQRIYRMTVPVYLHYPGGRVDRRLWTIDAQTASTSIETPERPDDVTLADGLETLAILKRMKAL